LYFLFLFLFFISALLRVPNITNSVAGSGPRAVGYAQPLSVTGQNGSGQNGTNKMVWTKWYGQYGMNKMV